MIRYDLSRMKALKAQVRAGRLVLDEPSRKRSGSLGAAADHQVRLELAPWAVRDVERCAAWWRGNR